VIIATIGLGMGALSHELYTMIVAMAIVTTMMMPPSLRWMMARVPLGEEELKRLEKEASEERQDVPKMERVLVYVDDSPNGRLAARLAGQFTAEHKMLVTVLEHSAAASRNAEEKGSREHLTEAAQAAFDKAVEGKPGEGKADSMVQVRAAPGLEALERELAKGYNIIFIGVDRPIVDEGHRFEERLQHLVTSFDGPVAIAVNGAGAAGPVDIPLDILIPTSGRPDARLATEIGLTLAKATAGKVTALHVFDPQEDTALLRGRSRRFGMSVLVDVHRLGKQHGVSVKGLTATNVKPEAEIRRAVRGGNYDLVVLGTSMRQGETKFLGPRSAALLRVIRTPALLIAR
jgi:nucleotide-binding universal stress UspA family protein